MVLLFEEYKSQVELYQFLQIVPKWQVFYALYVSYSNIEILIEFQNSSILKLFLELLQSNDTIISTFKMLMRNLTSSISNSHAVLQFAANLKLVKARKVVTK